VLTVIGVIDYFIYLMSHAAAAVSNDTELFKCCDGNDMNENGYSWFL